jgi:hypothetical protein
MNDKAKLIERLNEHPELLARVESLLDAVENKYGDMERADDVEERVIGEMQMLGLKALEEWAKTQSACKAQKFALYKKGRKDSKKNCGGILHTEK